MHNIHNNLRGSFILISFYFGQAVSRPLSIRSSVMVTGSTPFVTAWVLHCCSQNRVVEREAVRLPAIFDQPPIPHFRCNTATPLEEGRSQDAPSAAPILIDGHDFVL